MSIYCIGLNKYIFFFFSFFLTFQHPSILLPACFYGNGVCCVISRKEGDFTTVRFSLCLWFIRIFSTFLVQGRCERGGGGCTTLYITQKKLNAIPHTYSKVYLHNKSLYFLENLFLNK